MLHPATGLDGIGLTLTKTVEKGLEHPATVAITE